MANTTSSTLDALQLDPPKFTVDENNEDLELWSFRLPVSLSVSALKGIKYHPSKGYATFSADGKEYRLQLMKDADMESFRVLVPQVTNKAKGGGKGENGGDDDDKSSSSSSDDDDDEEGEGADGETTKGMLQPSKKAFSKHFQVLSSVPTLTESQLAPLEGPPPADKMRHAYAPVAQRTGLKRRWMPLGVAKVDTNEDGNDASKPKKRRTTSSSDPKEEAAPKEKSRNTSASKIEIESRSSKQIKTEQADSEDSDDSEESPEDKKLSKSERRAIRAEKKAAKKAKKEAKKSKKAAKKAKKEKN